MRITLTETNLCPSSCEYFHPEKTDILVEYCDLPNGEWVLNICDDDLQQCPLGKWDLRVAKGVVPTGE